MVGRLDESQQQSGEDINNLFRFLAVNQGAQQAYIERLQVQEQEQQAAAHHLAFKRRFKEETRAQEALYHQEKV